jgi:hypothetical protein
MRDTRCLQAMLPESGDRVLRCLEDKACAQDQDECALPPIASTEEALHTKGCQHVAPCRQRREACKAEGKEFDDYYCMALRTIERPSLHQAIQDCVQQQPCDAVDTCGYAVFARAGCR